MIGLWRPADSDSAWRSPKKCGTTGAEPPPFSPCPTQVATKFHYSRQLKPEKLTHHSTLEVIWTIIPTLIVLSIAVPSLTLIYSMDQHTDRPGADRLGECVPCWGELVVCWFGVHKKRRRAWHYG